MTRRKTTFLALLLLTLAGIFVGVTLYKQSQKAEAQERYAVILSLDGFRYMYLDELSTPNLDAIAAEGVSGSLQPSYPSNTFPNHYSMATGLYPEHHGIVNNRFWVDELNDYYKLGDSARVYNPAFYGGEPIWNTAEKQGIKAGSYFWVGSETAVQNMRPSYWKKYDAETSFTARADSVIAWLQKPIEERPRLITWYIQEPDHTGHTYGTGSDQLKAMVSTVDSVVGYFRSELAKLPIASQVDFIIVSDHGMKDYEPDKIVNLMDYLPADSFRYIVDGTPTLLYTKHPEYIDEAMKVLEKVPHVTAYRRADVPARFHYSEGDRLGDIVVMPELGGYIFFREKPELKLPAGHGFDNTLPEMQAILFGVGPSFAKGKKVSQVPNVAIYPLLCHILQLTPAPNDGTEEDVQKLLGH
ncbi:ectonucleotide pyrophosphatase/phosphodiesterase [uncultured Porphyromonas sp.]|uniref:alkaline phosphatase family protein n=1 Tax=uncultured Porphyromonas sp. TaxID=159274 RepID=UPI00262B4837|nr:ectonucleotide pyrophosphatase/phosphodiesterase [uncultured Porphyromonas sp.]